MFAMEVPLLAIHTVITVINEGKKPVMKLLKNIYKQMR